MLLRVVVYLLMWLVGLMIGCFCVWLICGFGVDFICVVCCCVVIYCLCCCSLVSVGWLTLVLVNSYCLNYACLLAVAC